MPQTLSFARYLNSLSRFIIDSRWINGQLVGLLVNSDCMSPNDFFHLVAESNSRGVLIHQSCCRALTWDTL